MIWFSIGMMLIATATLVLVALQWWFPPEDQEDYAEEYWECENCGFTVYSATMEGIVEGMRIHSIATECEWDWEPDDEPDV